MNEQSNRFIFEQVFDERTLKEEWYPLFVASFPDEDDREPIEQLLDRLANPEENKFHILRDYDGKAVGMELINLNPDIPGALYVPYAAVAAAARNRGIYPKMAEISDYQMKLENAKYILYDLENPKNIHEAFGEKLGGEATELARRRLDFWRRSPINTIVVDDPDLPYLRPASSDESKTQSYDLLAFRALGNNLDNLPAGTFSADGTQISKDAYRQFYLEMMRLQYGNLSEADLSEQLPAVKQFLHNVDNSPKQWVNLKTSEVRAKLTPNIQTKISAAAPG